MELHLGQVGRQKVGNIVDVALHIVKQLAKPFVALGHGGLGGHLAEDVAEMGFEGFHIIVVGLPQLLVGDDGRRSGQASEVECLGSRVESDAVLRKGLVEHGKRTVAVARQH